MASGFRSSVFDPLLVVSQIAALQCCFYISLGFWIFVADSIGDVHKTIDQIFNYRVSLLSSMYIHVHVSGMELMISWTFVFLCRSLMVQLMVGL